MPDALVVRLVSEVGGGGGILDNAAVGRGGSSLVVRTREAVAASAIMAGP